MSKISIDDLHLNGSDLFSDSEGFMMNLSDNNLTMTHGGITIPIITYLAYKAADYAVEQGW